MKSGWILICLFLSLSISIFAQDFQINIDGEKDAFYNTLTGPADGWFYLPPEAFNNNGPQPADEIDLSAHWYSAWDPTYLYVYVEITDDFMEQDNTSNYWANDCFDAKVDPDVNGASSNEVFCFAMTYLDSADVDPSAYAGVSDLVQTVGGGWVTTERPTPEDYARKINADGYVLECRVKWDWISTATKGPIIAEVGSVIGFAVSIHDNDQTTGREKSIQWAAQLLDAVWNNCTYMGYMELLPDNKIKYIPESLRDPSIVNPNPDMYIPLSTDVAKKPDMLKSYELSQNYPNPFNPNTTISYTLPKSSEVKLGVYDLLGNEVAVLVNGMKPAGIHTAKFDGVNLTSGIYFYKLQSEDKIISKKMVLIK